jgi:uncharacterized repeat protein (TIGR02543 family)
LPANPQIEGYIFLGWNSKKDGTGTKYTANSIINKNITLYAQWAPEGGVTVTFDSQGGGAVAALYLETSGASLGSLPEAPLKTGFDFAGWYTQPEGGGTPFTASTTVSADITVYAKWTPQSGTTVYTVSFMGEGGLFPNGEEEMAIQAAAGNTVSLPVPPLRQNYSFEGWYTAKNGGGTAFTASTTVSADISVYAKWQNTTLTVNFYNGGELYNTQTLSAGASAALPAEPAIDYQFFKGWYTGQNGAGTQFTASTTVSANINVYAYWLEFKVTFDSEGGNAAPATPIQKKGDKITNLPVPTHPDAEFLDFGGWFTGDGGTGTQFTAATPVNEPITVYAKWTPKAGVVTHTLTFNADGGTFDAGETKHFTVVAGHSVALPTPPTRQHYAFEGWYTAQNGGGTAFTAATTVNADITVYAKWTLNIKVRFYLVENDAAIFHEEAPASLGGTLTPPAPTARDGFSFKKWVYRSGETEIDFSAATPVNGDMTVYGKWAGLFTVQFNLNGADGTAPDSRAIEEGQALGALPPEPARAGFNFKGWYDNAAGTGSAYSAETLISANKTLYAQWAQLFTVQFNLNGGDGTAPDSRTIEGGQPLGALPAEPARAGYNFKGWHDNAEGTGNAYTAQTQIGAAKILYAQWAQLFTVTFNANSVAGVTGSTVQVESGASLGDAFPAPPAPRAGYAFQWNTQASGSGAVFTASAQVSASIEVYALWVEAWTATTSGIANTTLYEHLVKAAPSAYATGVYGSRTNVAKVTTSSAQFGYSIEITPSFTGTLKLNLSAQAMRSTAGKLYWKYSDSVFSAEAGNSDGDRNANQWYTYELTSTKAVTSGTKITIQLGGFSSENADFYLADFLLLAERQSNTSSIVLEDFENSPQLTNIGEATITSSIVDFNGSKILEVISNGTNRGTAFKVTIPDGKTLGSYTKLNVDANLRGTVDSGYKDMFIWVSDTLPASVSGTGNIKTASQIPGDDKSKLFPYSFTLSSFNNWSTAQHYTGEIYLVFGLAHSNGCAFGIDNISLEDNTPYTGFYPLYSGQQNLASGPISLIYTDEGAAAFDQAAFTIAKPSGSQAITLTAGWTAGTAKWLIDGKIVSTGGSVTINAEAYTTGRHTLTVIAYHEGQTVPWSKTLQFTVTETE